MIERFFLGTYTRVLHRFGPAVVALWTVWVLVCAWASMELPPERSFDTRDLFPPVTQSVRALAVIKPGSTGMQPGL